MIHITKIFCLGFFILLFIVQSANSQQSTFINTYSTILGYDIDQTFDGGFIVGGLGNQTPSLQPYVLKIDSIGDVLWSRRYGNELFRKIIQTSDSGFILVATCWPDSLNGDSSDVFIAKLKENGDTTWTRSIGGPGSEVPRSVAQTSDGGYVITVWYYPPVHGWALSCLLKVDSIGNIMWTKEFLPTASYQSISFESIIETSDKGLAIVGLYRDDSLGVNALLLKTDSIGNILWKKTYGLQSTNISYEFLSIAEATDSGFIMSGVIRHGLYETHALIVKTDLLGNLQWGKTFGSTFGNETGFSAFETNDSGFLLSGTSTGLTSYIDAYMVKTNQSGDSIWTRLFTGAYSGSAAYGRPTKDGGNIMVAALNLNSPQPTTIIKTDANGNSDNCEFRTPSIVGTVAGSLVPPFSEVNTVYSIHPYSSDNFITNTNKAAYCFNTNIKDIESENTIQIYPNPVNDKINLIYQNEIRKAEIRIFDMAGKEYYRNNMDVMKPDNPIDVSFLSKGIYWISVGDESFVGRAKFIKY